MRVALRKFLNRFASKPAQTWPKGAFRNAIAISELADDEMIRVVPTGDYPEHHDGAHEITAETVRRMYENWVDGGSIRILVDIDHESIWGPTKAAGWIHNLEAREDGLYASPPKFTPAVQKMVDEEEYAFFSPVYWIWTDHEGNLLNATFDSHSLTNRPYFRTEIDRIHNTDAPAGDDNQKPFMQREDLIEQLGLDADATDEQINEAIAAGREAVQAQTEPADEDTSGDVSEAGSEPDLEDEEAVTLEAVNRRLSAMETANAQAVAAANSARIDALVDAAISDGKILPADRAIYANAAKTDFAGTKKRLDAMKVNSSGPRRIETSNDKPTETNTFVNSIPRVFRDYVAAQA